MNPPASITFSTHQPIHEYMEIMDNIGEYQNYWETNRFLNDEEQLNSWAKSDQPFDLGYLDSSSPDGNASTTTRKTIVSERNRRKKLDEKLLALRKAVPRISKLDKASILKDAIEYIQDLQEQDRRLQAEIMELEFQSSKKNPFEHELPVLLRSKKARSCNQIYDPINIPIDVHQLQVTSMGERSLLVSLTCSKTPNTMIKLCEVFESLDQKIMAANVTTLSGTVKKTVLMEVDEGEKDHLKMEIKRAVSALCDSDSPISL